MNKRFKTRHKAKYSCLCTPAVRFAPWGLADVFRKEENAQGPCLWEEGALILHPKTKSLIYYRQCSTKSCPTWKAMQHPDARFSWGMRYPWHQPLCLAHAVPSHSRIFRHLQRTHFYHFPVFQHIPWHGCNTGTPLQWHCPCHLPQARGTDAVLYLLISILITTAGTSFIKGNISLSPNTNYWKNITHFKDFLRFMMLD